MKTGSISFPRQFGPGAFGKDCRAVKRALKDAGYKGMVDNGVFGDQAQENLAEFKHAHGLLSDPIYTLQAHVKLTRHFDAYGASLMSSAAVYWQHKHQRDAFVAARRWMVSHHSIFDYAEVRPWPRIPAFSTGHRIVSDCSGTTALAAYWAGCPDPSKLGFNGEANTGTFLHACSHIRPSNALPGDLIVYRASEHDTYGHHVVSIDRAEGGDFVVVSHGHQGDPAFYAHSAMAASQARSGFPDATFLRFIGA